MPRTTITRAIDAPVESVFATIADMKNFSKAVPHIVNVVFLSDVHAGSGTRFRETRLMHGKERSTELEVTEYVENERVRMVADTDGTVWDSLFVVSPVEGRTRLDFTMDARPHKLLPKLLVPLMKGLVQKAIEKDMDAVKAYCEK